MTVVWREYREREDGVELSRRVEHLDRAVEPSLVSVYHSSLSRLITSLASLARVAAWESLSGGHVWQTAQSRGSTGAGSMAIRASLDGTVTKTFVPVWQERHRLSSELGVIWPLPAVIPV